MQIDMHYYGVYVLARLASLKPEAAKIIAAASQYVDDAVEKEMKHHENGNKLAPIVTAHKIIEIMENRNQEDQPYVWVPFHFFPGNEGEDFTERLLCREDGQLINKLIDRYLDLSASPFALELIGLTAHIYADTFSHFGFSGVSSRRNKVDSKSIRIKNASAPTATYLDKKLDRFFRKFGFQGGLWTNIRRTIMSDGAEIASGALGHGAVAILPDLPYLQWEFTYEVSAPPGVLPFRDNTEHFLKACERIHDFFSRFAAVSNDYSDGTGGVNFNDVENEIEGLLSLQKGKSDRCEAWRSAFHRGNLGIPNSEEIPRYDPKIWDKQREDFDSMDHPEDAAEQEVYRFYQAASFHQHLVLRELFPEHKLMVI